MYGYGRDKLYVKYFKELKGLLKIALRKKQTLVRFGFILNIHPILWYDYLWQRVQNKAD